MKYLTVSPSELINNPWNTNSVDPSNEAKLEASVDRYGMFKPIIVRELEDGQLEILGGEHRNKTAIKKGIEKVPVINLGRIDDIKAKEISLIDNGRYGTDDSYALAQLLDELSTASDVDIGEIMPYSNEDLDRILTVNNIDLDKLGIDDDEDEEIDLPVKESRLDQRAQMHQIMRFKVPVADAHKVQEVINEIMKDQDYTGGDSLENAGDALVFLSTAYAKDKI